MQYEVYKVNPDTFERDNLIDEISVFNWQDDNNKIFTSFNFTAKKENDRIDKLFSDTSNLQKGDWIELYCPYNKRTVLFGQINEIDEKKDADKRCFITYSGFDYGLICDKETTIIQFDKNNETASQAIINTCQKVGIKTGIIETINNKIEKEIYKNDTVSKILQSVYKESIKDGYYFDCKNGKVNLLKYSENNDLKGYIANIYSIKSFEYVNSFEIKKETGKDDIISLTVLGDCNIQKGVITNIDLENIGIKGKYLIINSEHSIIGTRETIKTNLKLMSDDL